MRLALLITRASKDARIDRCAVRAEPIDSNGTPRLEPPAPSAMPDHVKPADLEDLNPTTSPRLSTRYRK
jgi:hypothetical protein